MDRLSIAKIRAFTLVELLVVIGIIALLISILLPSLNRARQSAMAIDCASNLRQYGIADEMYMNENRNWHVPCFWGSYYYNRTWTGLLAIRKTLGWPVLNPQDTNTYTVPGITNTTNGANGWCYVPKKFYCPIALRGATEYYYPPLNAWLVPMLYSYGMNVEGVDDATGSATASATTPAEAQAYDPADFPQCSGKGSVPDLDAPYEASSANYRPYFPTVVGSFHGFRSNQIKHPDQKLFMTDALGIGVNEDGAGLSNPPALFTYEDYDQIGETTTAGAERSTAWRHLGKANVLFFDGHVASLRHDQLANRDPTTGNWVGNDNLWKVGL